VRSILKDEGQAELAMEEVWYAAHDRLAACRGTECGTFLTRLALELARERLAHRAGLRGLSRPHLKLARLDSEEPGTSRKLLEVAVGALPEQDRIAFLLREVEGLPAREAAACLGLSEREV